MNNKHRKKKLESMELNNEIVISIHHLNQIK